jgi:hypothetical protein
MTIRVPIKHTFTYGNVTCNVYHANKGEGLPSHVHTFAHGTICSSGSIVIRKDDKEVIATKKDSCFNLVAAEYHEIEALEDNTVFMNIFVTDFAKDY